MSTNPALANTDRFLRPMIYVLVNHRVPRTDLHCALCGGDFQEGYIRELQTRLPYCDAQCLAGHARMGMRVIEDRSRKAS